MKYPEITVQNIKDDIEKIQIPTVTSEQLSHMNNELTTLTQQTDDAENENGESTPETRSETQSSSSIKFPKISNTVINESISSAKNLISFSTCEYEEYRTYITKIFNQLNQEVVNSVIKNAGRGHSILYRSIDQSYYDMCQRIIISYYIITTNDTVTTNDTTLNIPPIPPSHLKSFIDFQKIQINKSGFFFVPLKENFEAEATSPGKNLYLLILDTEKLNFYEPVKYFSLIYPIKLSIVLIERTIIVCEYLLNQQKSKTTLRTRLSKLIIFANNGLLKLRLLWGINSMGRCNRITNLLKYGNYEVTDKNTNTTILNDYKNMRLKCMTKFPNTGWSRTRCLRLVKARDNMNDVLDIDCKLKRNITIKRNVGKIQGGKKQHNFSNRRSQLYKKGSQRGNFRHQKAHSKLYKNQKKSKRNKQILYGGGGELTLFGLGLLLIIVGGAILGTIHEPISGSILIGIGSIILLALFGAFDTNKYSGDSSSDNSPRYLYETQNDENILRMITNYPTNNLFIKTCKLNYEHMKMYIPYVRYEHNKSENNFHNVLEIFFYTDKNLKKTDYNMNEYDFYREIDHVVETALYRNPNGPLDKRDRMYYLYKIKPDINKSLIELINSFYPNLVLKLSEYQQYINRFQFEIKYEVNCNTPRELNYLFQYALTTNSKSKKPNGKILLTLIYSYDKEKREFSINSYFSVEIYVYYIDGSFDFSGEFWMNAEIKENGGRRRITRQVDVQEKVIKPISS